MLPSLGRLSLTRTGGSLAPGQSPEDVTCVICFHSLAEPPPDGENVWPFDDDPVIWIVACNNQHAFHKGCLRAYARDSEDPSRCPECRVPMLPQVLTHVSRPSSGEHAAREAREAEERAEGQERDREDARRRERENLERMEREFQEMDAEDRRMHADAYGDQSSSDEEEWDSEREEQAELDARDRQEMLDARAEHERRHPMRLASDDIEEAIQVTGRIARTMPAADRSYSAYMRLANVIDRCISRGSLGSGNDAYRLAMILELTDSSPMHLTRGWFRNTIIVCADSICPPAVKGQLLRLLAAYANDPRVMDFLREMNAQQRGRASWDAAGAFEDAVRRYVAHLEGLGPAPTSRTQDEATFESNTKDSRLIDAKRVLHYLKWDEIVRDEWLLPYNGRPIVDEGSDHYQMLVAMDWERIIPETRGRVEYLVSTLGSLGTYDEATKPDVYDLVKANLRAVLADFRVWHEHHSGFDEYDLENEHPRFPFPFGREIAQLWALANHMHLEREFRPEEEPAQGHIEIEKLERYDQMKEMLTRLVWLGVTWWIGRPYPQNNDSATPDEMDHFFWAYVAPKYDQDDDTELMFKYESLNDLATVINRNNMMRNQWIGDRRTGPWFRNLGMDDAEREAERAERQAQRVRDGGETPDARRQRRA